MYTFRVMLWVAPAKKSEAWWIIKNLDYLVYIREIVSI